eukprot:102930-Chlamydomonas_euryale.AAC.2
MRHRRRRWRRRRRRTAVVAAAPLRRARCRAGARSFAWHAADRRRGGGGVRGGGVGRSSVEGPTHVISALHTAIRRGGAGGGCATFAIGAALHSPSGGIACVWGGGGVEATGAQHMQSEQGEEGGQTSDRGVRAVKMESKERVVQEQ